MFCFRFSSPPRAGSASSCLLRDLAYCFLLGTLGVAVSNYFYYVAIQRTNVATAIIVQYTAPVWVLLYVVARGQQKLTLQKVVAVALAVTGIALVIDIFGASQTCAGLRLDSYGLFAALLASFSFAFYNVGGHRILARHDRWRVLVWTLTAAAAFWLVVNPPWKIVAAHYAPAQWLFLFVFSMISVLGAFSLYFLGLQHLEPTRAIIASCLEPVFSILLAALLLGEVLRPIQTAGNRLCAGGDRDRAAPRSQRARIPSWSSRSSRISSADAFIRAQVPRASN